MRWCFENTTHAYADEILQRLIAGKAFVPALWRYEASAVLAKAQKDGIITASKAEAFLTTLQSLNITLDYEGMERIFSDVHRLAIRYSLTSYDASYLELAIRRKLPLATLDAALIAACKAAGETIV